MTATSAVAATWARALTLSERSRGADRPLETERGAARLKRWKTQPPFDKEPGLFAERLRQAGLSEQELAALLGEPSTRLADRLLSAADWLDELHGALSHAHPVSDTYADELAILIAAEPLIERGRDELLRRVGLLDAPFDWESLIRQLTALLPARLFPMLARTIAHELHTATEQGLLPGETPAERFGVFIEYMAEGGALDLFEAYPVLGRQVAACVRQWVDACGEALDRLASDLAGIGREFNDGADPGRLDSVQGGLSDPHAGGREVLIFTFASGLKVVYKPKPVRVDAHFQDLLAWLNARGEHPPLRRIRVLDRGEYGWVEFVSSAPCASEDDVERFYRRQGCLLAVLHVVAATDLHFENVVAAGEDPVLIDLEALFHPDLRSPGSGSAFEAALSAMDNSVLAVGMLPQALRLSPGSEGVDVSALGAGDGQLSPRGVARWVGGASGEARIVYERVAVGDHGQHPPVLHGRAVDVLEHTEAFLAGFEQTYALLLARRRELLQDDGPLMAFADDTVRLLLRPTVVYARVLSESFGPDLLRDALERDRFFDRLWVAVPNQPRLVPAIASEQEDLWRGDIPKFTTAPSSRLVRSAAGDELDGVIVESGLSVVRRRLQGMAEADLRQQRWFVLAALGSLPDAREPVPSVPSVGQPLTCTRAELIASAQEIGERLARMAILGDDDASWIGLASIAGSLSVVPLGADLYDGLPGVALFLATLGRVTGDRDALDLARRTLRRLRRQLDDGLAPLVGIGAFGGWGGLVYAYTRLSVLLDDSTLLAQAHSIAVDRIQPLVGNDAQLDIAEGAAGCIGALAALLAADPADATLEVAIACGERLLEAAQAMPTGIAWNTPVGSALTGFAHGAAGFAWALQRLFVLTGEKRYWLAAQSARAYEASVFTSDVGNWPDLRSGGKRGFMLAWCHGAPGIGLGRVASLRTVNDTALLADIDAAVAATLAAPAAGSHALCHGELGNLDLLVTAARRLERPALREMALVRAQAVLAAEGWTCATPFGVQTPGLMTGLAGIGYGLLRVAAPELVPSVLALEAPEP